MPVSIEIKTILQPLAKIMESPHLEKDLFDFYSLTNKQIAYMTQNIF